MKGVDEQRPEIRIEWMEPRKWLVPIKDAIEIYNLYERVLIKEKDEQEKYLRGELTTILDNDAYRASKERTIKIETILTQQAWYIDDLVYLMNELRMDENTVIVDYLMDKDLTQQELADRYDLDKSDVLSKLRAVKYALDGKVGYTSLKSGSIKTIQHYLSEHGVI